MAIQTGANQPQYSQQHYSQPFAAPQEFGRAAAAPARDMPRNISPDVAGMVPAPNRNWHRDAQQMLQGNQLGASPDSGFASNEIPGASPVHAANHPVQQTQTFASQGHVPASGYTDYRSSQETYASHPTQGYSQPNEMSLPTFADPQGDDSYAEPSGDFQTDTASTQTGYVPPVHVDPYQYQNEPATAARSVEQLLDEPSSARLASRQTFGSQHAPNLPEDGLSLEQFAAQARAENARRHIADQQHYDQERNALFGNEAGREELYYDAKAAAPRPPQTSRMPQQNRPQQNRQRVMPTSTAPIPSGYRPAGQVAAVNYQSPMDTPNVPVGYQPPSQPTRQPSMQRGQVAPPAQQSRGPQIRQPVSLPTDTDVQQRSGFQPRSGMVDSFRRQQLSGSNLTERRGPGLQERISGLLSSGRYRDVSATGNSMSAPVDGQMMMAQTVAVQAPRQLDPVGQSIQDELLARRSKTSGQNVRPTPVERAYVREDDAVVPRFRERNEEPQMHERQPDQYVSDRSQNEVAQVAMDEPGRNAMADPFADYPQVRDNDSPVRHAYEQVAMLDERGRPISVLERGNDRDNSRSSESRDNKSRDNESRMIQSDYPLNRGYQDSQETATQPDPFAPRQDAAADSTQRPDRNNRFDDPLGLRDQERNDELRNEELERLPDIDQEPLNDPLRDRFGDPQRDRDGQDETLDDPTHYEKSCQEFRDELLSNPITNIALDISPPRQSQQSETAVVSRTWTDRAGNPLADGIMVDLRRGYVIVDGGGGRQKLAFARLSDDDLVAVADFWKLPTECTIGNHPFYGRNWMPQTFTWKSTSLCHKPLYFENIQLERYGHSHGPFMQPVHSVGHFFSSLFFMPYQTAINPPNECQYALGYYRPGDCAPWLKEPMPISLNGRRRQAAVGAAFFLIP